MANSIGYEAITVSTTAIGPTAATVRGGVRSAIFFSDPAGLLPMRWRSDGTAPTSTVGNPFYPGQTLIIVGEGNIRNIKFIRTGGVDLTLHANYYDQVDVVGMGSTGAITSGATGPVVDTELPAAAALADATSNPNTPTVGADLLGFNGTTWDRLRQDNTGALRASIYGKGTLAGDTPVLVDSSGRVVSITGNAIVPSDGVANNTFVGIYGINGPVTGQMVASLNYNGTTWDRHRNKGPTTFLASASRTTTQTSADIPTYNCNAIYVVLDMTVVGAGPSVTLAINFKDPASGKYIALLTGAAVTTVSTNVYKIGPALTAAVNAAANEYLPDTLQIVVTANNANAGTYSVGYILIAK